jgi:hypothetical protein
MKQVFKSPAFIVLMALRHHSFDRQLWFGG